MNKLFSFILLSFLSGCSTVNHQVMPEYIGYSKDHGTIVVGHYYLVLTDTKHLPTIDWDRGDTVAERECQRNGYTAAIRVKIQGKFEHEFCQSYHSDITLPPGVCAEKLVAAKYKCLKN
ncbi:hypothetical protein [Vibrio rotiferianus]|uniref:hypothetical protein n=1 Tax=Vibrio rotiferianus TaxID=190895 RepID=UPI00406A40E3